MSRYNCNVVESVCNLWQVGSFLLVLWFPLPIKMSRYNCFIGRGNQSTRRKPPTCHRLQTLSTTLQLYRDIFIGWGNQSTRRKLPTCESICNLRQVGSFLLVLWFPLPIKMSRYNCNVVESVCNLRQVGGFLLDIFIGRGNQSTRRKPPTCRRLQTLSTTLQLYRDIFIGCGFLNL
jgi:hypothetical protein